MAIHSSLFPPMPLQRQSVFTHLFSSSDPAKVGRFSASFPAFIDAETGITLTRGSLKHHALTFAYGVTRHPKLLRQKRGDTLLIYAPNSIGFIVALFGAVAGGLKVSPANTAYVSKELGHQYADSGAGIIVTTAEGLAVVQEMFASIGIGEHESHSRIIVLPDELGWVTATALVAPSRNSPFVNLEDVLSLGKLDQEELFGGTLSQETCYVCYSSGTTGKPKGVETTHYNMTTVIDISTSVFRTYHGQDRFLGFLPFFHIYGVLALIHHPFVCGNPLIVQKRFDPVQFCRNIDKYKITVAVVVPPVMVVLARHPAVDSYKLTSLRVLFSAAAPLGGELIDQVINRLRKKDVRVSAMQGYGLTETSPISHVLPADLALRRPGSIGLLLPNLESRIVNEGSALDDVAPNQPGELWLRGPTIMKGYLNNVKATKESITEDGWFKTGDICVRDDEGFYFIVDRRKELIKYKGFQVPPSELESVLLTHPDIADAAVIGVDILSEATELPRAYVVHAQPGHVKTTNAREEFSRSVQKWMESKVANHKFLRGGVAVIDAIPKSAAGKILRRELRDQARNEVTARSKL